MRASSSSTVETFGERALRIPRVRLRLGRAGTTAIDRLHDVVHRRVVACTASSAANGPATAPIGTDLGAACLPSAASGDLVEPLLPHSGQAAQVGGNGTGQRVRDFHPPSLRVSMTCRVELQLGMAGNGRRINTAAFYSRPPATMPGQARRSPASARPTLTQAVLSSFSHHAVAAGQPPAPAEMVAHRVGGGQQADVVSRDDGRQAPEPQPRQ
jgi:hypothetical protein